MLAPPFSRERRVDTVSAGEGNPAVTYATKTA